MPTICIFRGIKIYMNWREHQPPHFHAKYGGEEVVIGINDAEVLEGSIPSKQLKLLLGWTVLHQDELMDNWKLAEQKQELFPIDGEKRLYDVKPLDGVFAALKPMEVFKRVYIDDCGCVAWDKNPNIDSNVVWDNKIDLCPDSCYLDSKEVQ